MKRHKTCVVETQILRVVVVVVAWLRLTDAEHDDKILVGYQKSEKRRYYDDDSDDDYVVVVVVGERIVDKWQQKMYLMRRPSMHRR